MNTQDRINQLQSELASLKREQGHCQHTFGEPFRASRTERVPVTENRPMGSDYFNPVIVGWEDKHTPIWKRVCSKCGLEQETTKEAPVVVGTKPVF